MRQSIFGKVERREIYVVVSNYVEQHGGKSSKKTGFSRHTELSNKMLLSI